MLTYSLTLCAIAKVVYGVASGPFILIPDPSLGSEPPYIIGADIETIVVGQKYFFIATQKSSFNPSNPSQELPNQLQDLHPLYHITSERTLFPDSVGSWGLDRINQPSLPLDDDDSMPSTNAGAGVDVYVLDSGANTKHPDFESRVSWGNNFIDDQNTDCNGHGTHVMGIVLSKTYGVAKKANGIAVKIMNCAGSGSYSGLIQAISWCVKQAAKTGRPSIMQMSLGGPFHQAANDVIAAARKAGVLSSVSAGNSAVDACNASPASAPYSITVGSLGFTDTISPFSNFGSCVSLFAPGERIVSTSSSGATMVYSGTSQAAPHVAGVLAQIYSANSKLLADDAENALLGLAAQRMIPDSRGSPNLLVQVLKEGASLPPKYTGMRKLGPLRTIDANGNDVTVNEARSVSCNMLVTVSLILVNAAFLLVW